MKARAKRLYFFGPGERSNGLKSRIPLTIFMLLLAAGPARGLLAPRSEAPSATKSPWGGHHSTHAATAGTPDGADTVVVEPFEEAEMATEASTRTRMSGSGGAGMVMVLGGGVAVAGAFLPWITFGIP